MALWRGLAARRDLDDLHVGEVTAPGQVGECAARLEPRPRRQIELEEVQPEPLMDRDAFGSDPVLVRIDQEPGLGPASSTSVVVQTASPRRGARMV